MARKTRARSRGVKEDHMEKPKPTITGVTAATAQLVTDFREMSKSKTVRCR